MRYLDCAHQVVSTRQIDPEAAGNWQMLLVAGIRELERSCDFRHYVAEVACSVGTCCGGPVREHAVGVSGMTRVRRSCLVLQYVGTRDSQPC